MAQRETAPYRPQNVGEISTMLQGLESHQGKGKGKGGFSCRKNVYVLPNGQSVDSWRMQDWDYKKENLPTYARGLFTTKNKAGQPEIVVRGYDKFFNHGEVRKTEWPNVEKYTRGPYELSVKENGCIIFIAGLEDGSLIVCSKHSTGDRSDVPISHAKVGEKWVDKHLATVGKTRADLARQLRAMNATAVAELCDDAFEEHVLAYKPDQAGLYLHGINLNLPEFVTYPGQLVDKFAEEWGFKKTMYVMEDDIGKVKSFLDGIAETGAYNGRDTEGFVIRCQAKESRGSEWEDWFFKYKFEEPYLMYRQWRECTKSIISGWAPKIRKHKKITEEYLLYARKCLATDPNLGKLYNQNHGIIKLREDFLASRGLTGADIIRQEIDGGEEEGIVTKNVILVPIATLGCGKTTIALALSKLFGWGHFQNDNVVGKNRPQRFTQSVCSQLAAHPVVFADRNNHQKRERAQLINDVRPVVPNATMVALHWVHDKNDLDRLQHVRQTLRERVLNRGDNHQTIQAGSKSQDEIVGIMDGFIHRFESLDKDKSPDSDFDLVIDLDPTATSRESLEVIVSRLYEEYPKLFSEDMPTAADLDNAIEAAMTGYTVEIKHDLSGKFGQNAKNKPKNLGPKSQREQVMVASNSTSTRPPKEPKLEFFAVRLPAQRVSSILEAIFRNKDASTAQLYRQLAQSRRIQAEFHVTLIHRSSAQVHAQQWDSLSKLHYDTFHPMWEKAAQEGTTHAIPEPELGKCQVQLERLVWDNRVMAFVVRIVSDKFETTNTIAHVTVGTVNPNVKPKESNDVLARWLEVGSGQGTGIWEEKVLGNVVLEGSVRGVLQRLGR